MNDDAVPAITSTSRAQAQACDQCSAVKRKCVPGDHGCAACVSAGKSCTYQRVRRKRGPRPGHAQETEARLERLAKTLRSVLGRCDEDTESLIKDMLLEDDLRLPGQGDREDTASAISDKKSEDPDSNLADMAGVLTLNDNSELRYFGRMSGLNMLETPASPTGTFLLPRNIRLTLLPEQQGVPALRPAATVQELIPGTAAPQPLAVPAPAGNMYALPDADTQVRLLAAYWAHVHPHIPILYRPALIDRLPRPQHFSLDETLGTKNDLIPPFLLLAVFAVAARFIRDGQETPRPGAHWPAGDKYVAQAKWLLASEEFNFRDLGSSRLTTVQGLLLLAYREAGIGAMCHSWFLGGSAFRMAIDIALYRDPDLLSQDASLLPYEVKESRRRTWYGCIAFDRYISMYLGRPVALPEKDWDTEMPGTDEPDEHERWRPVPLGSQILNGDGRESSKAYAISTFNQASRLNVILSRISDDIYAIRRDRVASGPALLLRKREDELRAFLDDLPPHLRYDLEDHKTPPPNVLVLHCQYNCVVILLHMPFFRDVRHAQAPEALKHSLTAVSSAAERISRLATRHDQLHGLGQTAPFMVFYIWSAALVHLSLLTNYKDRLESRDHLRACIHALEKMETTWGAASRQREMLLAPFSTSAQPSRDLSGNAVKLRKGRDRGDDDDSARPTGSRRLKVKHNWSVKAAKQESLSPPIDSLQSPARHSAPTFAEADSTWQNTSDQSFGMAGFHSDFTFSLGANDPYYSLFSLPSGLNSTLSGSELTSPTAAAPLSTTLDAYMQSLQPEYDTASSLFLPPLSYFLASPPSVPNFDGTDPTNQFLGLSGQI